MGGKELEWSEINPPRFRPRTDSKAPVTERVTVNSLFQDPQRSDISSWTGDGLTPAAVPDATPITNIVPLIQLTLE